MSEWFKRVFFQATVVSALVILAISFPIFQPVSGLFFFIIATFLVLYGFSDPKYMFRRLIASLVALLVIPNIFSQTIDSLRDTLSSSTGLEAYKLALLDILSFAYNDDNFGYILSAICILSVLEIKNIVLDIAQTLSITSSANISPIIGRFSGNGPNPKYYCKINVHNSSSQALYINSARLRISFFRVETTTIHEDESEKPLKLASHSSPIEIPPGSMKCIAIYGVLRKAIYLIWPVRKIKKKLGIGYSASLRFNGSGNVSTLECPITFNFER